MCSCCSVRMFETNILFMVSYLSRPRETYEGHMFSRCYVTSSKHQTRFNCCILSKNPWPIIWNNYVRKLFYQKMRNIKHIFDFSYFSRPHEIYENKCLVFCSRRFERQPHLLCSYFSRPREQYENVHVACVIYVKVWKVTFENGNRVVWENRLAEKPERFTLRVLCA